MTTSLIDLRGDALRVRAYLESAMPQSKLMTENLLPGYQPLLFMWMEHMMAAFAFSNGDTTTSYEALYGGFKRYYAKQRMTLDEQELSFVFCVPQDLPDLDQFCSNVEMDVYFCRKFVIPIYTPLETSFARLPFLPLTQVGGQSIRPPSAQTFLRQCKVPAILARYLVVPQQRSPQAIVKDCTEAKFGKPVDLEVPVQSDVRTSPPEQGAEAIRLKSISIENFRAYRKAQRFDLSADVTVLYGPNGFGKTSFFDAIDFVSTGEIGRFWARGIEGQFNKTATHLDSTPQDSVVSLEFTSNGVAHNVTRRVSTRKHPFFDGVRCDRKKVLTELTGGALASVDRIEHLVSLFRATHIFSQEYPELAKKFERDCELSEQIVSRMLAFEDYSSASKKAFRVCEILQEQLEHATGAINDLSKEVADDNKTLQRLDISSQEHIEVRALHQAVTSLRRRFEEAKIPVPTGEPDLAFARTCRSAVDARRSETQARIERLSSIAKQVAEMPTLNEEIAVLQEKQVQLKLELTAMETELFAGEQEEKRNDLLLVGANTERLNAYERSALLKWVAATKPRYEQILKRQRDCEMELKHARSNLDQLRADGLKAVSNLRVHERKAKESRARLEDGRNALVALRALVDGVKSWESDLRGIAVLEADESNLLKKLEKLRKEEQILSSQLAKNSESKERLRHRINEVNRTQSEVRQLLSQLEGHVRSGSCPLCGQDHGSKSELLNRIRRQMAEDTASDIRAELVRVQEQVELLSQNVASTRSALEHENATLESLRQDKAGLYQRIKVFESDLGKMGISISATDLTSQEVTNRHTHERQEVARIEQLVQKDQDELAETQAAVVHLRERIAKAEETVANVTDAVENSQAETASLREDPRAAQLPLDTEPRELTELEKLNSAKIINVDAAFADAKKIAKKSTEAADNSRHRVKALRSDLVDLRNKINNLKKTVTETRARLEESRFPIDADEAAVLRAIDKEAKTLEQLRELQDLTVSFELAIDTATTAAALQHQRDLIRLKELRIKQAKEIIEQRQPWQKYFLRLSDLVSSQQHEAIANFARLYGPRTSVIQRRLRAVYGFDEINIRSHESTIHVRVKRAGEELRPTDYFSQSQQQTLLLSLFLTACISQTWSTLQAFFFDDPVTHFDDLNNYAFLDLILGLLDSKSGPRQFVISTCDEKILHLARHKFRHLGKNATFYAFTAIDGDGPNVKEIDPVEV